MGLLNYKNIVIIGALPALVCRLPRHFVTNGANIIVVGRNAESAESAKQLLGDHAEALVSDAVSPDTSINAINTCIKHYGGFDGLYHVAGGSGRKMGDGPLDSLTLDGWNKTMELNLTSLMLSNQAAIKKFIELRKGGTILNMGSVLGYSPSPNYFSTHAYAAAKSAVIGFTKSVAAYYAKDNIRVNVIAPALVETPMAQRAAQDDTIVSFIKSKQPLDGGRVGQPE